MEFPSIHTHAHTHAHTHTHIYLPGNITIDSSFSLGGENEFVENRKGTLLERKTIGWSKRLLDRCGRGLSSKSEGVPARKRYCKHVITFNEGPGRGKIWPGSKNFSNFNPSFVAGATAGEEEEEEKGKKKESGNCRPVTSCCSGEEGGGRERANKGRAKKGEESRRKMEEGIVNKGISF